jgi:hypothetical protein
MVKGGEKLYGWDGAVKDGNCTHRSRMQILYTVDIIPRTWGPCVDARF